MGKKNNEMEESMAEVMVDESLMEGAENDRPAGEAAGTVEGDPMAEPSGTVADRGDGKAAGTVAGGNTTLSVEGGNNVAGGDGNSPTAEPSGTVADGDGNGNDLVIPAIDGANEWSANRQRQETNGGGESEKESTTTGTSGQSFDYEKFKELDRELTPTLMGRTRASVVRELFGGDLDPNKAEREKADADRRRRRHEGVEAVRLLIEGLTGTAKGRVIKRDKINYAQYEAEKEKVDATRRAALDKLYAAMAADDEMARNIRMKLMQLATVNNQSQTSKGKESHTQWSKTDQNGYSYGFKPFSNNKSNVVINNGGDGREDWYTFSIPYKKYNKKGELIESGNKNIRFAGGKQAYHSALTNIANHILSDKNLIETAKAIMKNSGYPIGKGDDDICRQILSGTYQNDEINTWNLREHVLTQMIGTNKHLWDIAVGCGFTEMSKPEDVNRNHLYKETPSHYQQNMDAPSGKGDDLIGGSTTQSSGYTPYVPTL